MPAAERARFCPTAVNATQPVEEFAIPEFLPINVWRGPDGMIITAQIPGVKLDVAYLLHYLGTLS